MPIKHLPVRFQPAAYRLRRWCLSDAPALLMVAVISGIYGCACLGVLGGHRGRLHPVEGLAPIELWGAAWGIVAIIAMLGLVLPASQAAVISLTGWAVLMEIWGTSYFVAFVTGQWQRGIDSSAIHIMMPVVVAWALWRGHRAEILIREVPHATTTGQPA